MTDSSQNLVRQFTLKSAGPQDNGNADWISSGNVSSTTQDPVEGSTSFLIAKGGSFTTVPISTRGPGGLTATSVQISFLAKTLYSAAPAMPEVTGSISFDGGTAVVQQSSISANAPWQRVAFTFPAPAAAQSFTLVLTYEGDMSNISTLIDNITVSVRSYASSQSFLASKYDEVCWLCTHNAYANYADGWLWAQQSIAVADQLKAGVRALMLDIDDEDGEVYLLHAGWARSSVLRPGFSSFRRLTDTLKDVNDFLDANPEEIVTIFFESDVKNSANFPLVVQAFQNAGTTSSNLAQKLFRYDQPNVGTNGSWSVAAQGAPNLQWMVDNNKRCLVFSSLRGLDTNSVQPSAPDGWAKMWHFIRESVYENSSSLDPGQWTNQRAESQDAEVNAGRTLNLVNHWPDWAVGSILPASTSFGSINDAELIERHLNEWTFKYQRLPNFIAVDYFDTGANGGPLTAVRNCNARWADRDVHSDPPPVGPLLTIGNSVQQVKSDLSGSTGTGSRVALALTNISDSDFALLRSYARHGKIVDDLPGVIPGRVSDPVQLSNYDGSVASAGVSTVMAGLIGPQCFWLLQASGYAKLLFIGVSSPYSLMFYNNYANARWIDRTDAVNSFINDGSGGDGLFDSLFEESNDDTSTYEEARIRARPWICGTWAMRNNTPGDMTVTLWSY